MSGFSLEECTVFLLTRSALAVTSTFKKILAKKGLTEIKPSYLGALICLWETAAMDEVLGKFGHTDGMTLTELGRCAGVEPSTITGLVDRMERDGLVERMPVHGDRRAQQAVLTEKGHALRVNVFNALDDLEADIFAEISQNDLATTKQTLRKIIEKSTKNKPGK